MGWRWKTAQSLGTRWSRVLAVSAIVPVGFAAVFASVISPALTPYEFLMQDRQVAVLFFVVLAASLLWLPAVRLPGRPPGLPVTLAASGLLTLALWAGSYRVLLNYPWTLDEFMATFDQAVFANGRLAWPTPPGWSAYAHALFPYFLLDTPGHAVLASSYLPMNAALRAVFALVLDPALMNPALVGGGLLVLRRVALRLFPETPGAVWTVLVGYVLSAQILVAAMSAYAMTAHLVLNLAWLALFLRRDRLGWAGAILVGFIASGLHQVVFHPLFAAPFIAVLAAERRWRAFAGFCLAYLAIALFWTSYPAMVMAWAGLASGGGGVSADHGFLAGRLAPLLLHRDPNTLPLMVKNVLRAICWNAVFLLPLLLFAWPAIRRREGIALPLALGMVLTVVVVALVVPDQGHGWGYRYVHGVLGNVLLLAGYGYREMARAQRSAADGLVVALAGVTAVVVLPFLLGSAQAFVRPAWQLSRLIERQESDFVILDTLPPGTAVKQVRNRPDLANRPLVLSGKDLTEVQVRELCVRGTVTPVGRRQFHQAGQSLWLAEANPEFDRLVASIRGRPCLRAARP